MGKPHLPLETGSPAAQHLFLASYGSPPPTGGRDDREQPFYAANPSLTTEEDAASPAGVLGDPRRCTDECSFTLLPGRYVLELGSSPVNGGANT